MGITAETGGAASPEIRARLPYALLITRVTGLSIKAPVYRWTVNGLRLPACDCERPPVLSKLDLISMNYNIPIITLLTKRLTETRSVSFYFTLDQNYFGEGERRDIQGVNVLNFPSPHNSHLKNKNKNRIYMFHKSIPRHSLKDMTRMATSNRPISTK